MDRTAASPSGALDLHEHLGQLVRYAPPGTLVPVDALAELLKTYERTPLPDQCMPVRPECETASPVLGLTMGDVAERFARVVGGEVKMVKECTVRRWTRVGLRGVRLKAYLAGRHLRVLEEDFNAFVRQLADQVPSMGRDLRRPLVPSAKKGTASEVPAAASEIDAYLNHFMQSVPEGGARRQGRRKVA